jgi:hypothetical protein
MIDHRNREPWARLRRRATSTPATAARTRKPVGRAVAAAVAVVCAVAGFIATAPGTAQADQTPSFTHWTASGPAGATGTLSGATVTLAGPMGTGFYPHDDFTYFNSPVFTPQLAATGTVEMTGGTGHTFTLTFSTPIQSPVMMLGSFGSIMTFAPGTNLTRLSGDCGFQTNGRVVTGTAANAVVRPDGTLGPTDSNGTIRLNGTYTSITFTLVQNFTGGSGIDGVYLQVGGTL